MSAILLQQTKKCDVVEHLDFLDTPEFGQKNPPDSENTERTVSGFKPVERLDFLDTPEFGQKNSPDSENTERIVSGFKPVERLDKIIAERMNVSRKDAKILIKSGKVTVNGAVAKSDSLKCTETDNVKVDGKVLNLSRHVYYMMNKPAGVLSATEDKSCETVLDLLPPELFRKGLFPAGRLDKDTEGFVFITDDGDFAHKMLSPKNHVPKTYYAVLNDIIPEKLPEAFAKGLDIGGGDICSPAKITILKNIENAEVEVTIYEGMYHQIKRMFHKFSLDVKYLKRISIGGLSLDPDLPSGHVREILHKELQAIM